MTQEGRAGLKQTGFGLKQQGQTWCVNATVFWPIVSVWWPGMRTPCSLLCHHLPCFKRGDACPPALAIGTDKQADLLSTGGRWKGKVSHILGQLLKRDGKRNLYLEGAVWETATTRKHKTSSCAHRRPQVNTNFHLVPCLF